MSEEITQALQQTCLYQEHVALGAKMSPFAGFMMPIQYSSITQEHLAVRQKVGMFDVSHMGEIFVEGPQAEQFVNWIFTNEIRGSENARLTSPLFLQRYSRFLRPGGIVHLKTDSRFLYEYTQSVVRANDLEVLAFGTDIYHSIPVIPSEAKESLPDLDAVFEVQTFYEQMFLKMGRPITYLAFRLDREGLGAGAPFAYPTDFDAAYWREVEGPRRSFSHQPSKG